MEGEPPIKKDGVGATLRVGEDSSDTLLTWVALKVGRPEVENVAIPALLDGIDD